MLTFPELPGNDVTVTWRPLFNTNVQQHESGGEYRLSYWANPLWEWEVSFNFLRQGFRAQQGYDELGKIMGLFLASNGSTFGFRYRNKDDYQVRRQYIGTTDGVASDFTLVRTFGQNNQALGLVGTEPIGLLDDRLLFKLYVDDSPTAVDPDGADYPYTLALGTAVKQQVQFATVPAAGHKLYVDMTFFYYARFKDSSQDFAKFAANLWELQKTTLRSMREEVVPT